MQLLQNLKKVSPTFIKNYYHIFVSIIGSFYFGFPETKLKIIGVTGTSGKSTTTNIIFHILKESGYKVGMLSTVGAKVGDTLLDTGLHVTTPDPFDLKRLLSLMVKAGVEYVVVETSSHSLAQGRVGNVRFDHAVFTNIKSDHLDWHGTWENYASAKALLGKKTKKGGKIVINRGDKKAYQFLRNFLKEFKNESDILSYSLDEAQNVSETAQGIAFSAYGTVFQVPILGLYNIENILAAATLAHTLGLRYEQVSESMSKFYGIEGRMQIMLSAPYLVIVDYAHNTDSLERSLRSARKLVKSGGRLIAIFGSAGLRDIEKRYTMGETSAALADITVITSEDPRIEKLSDINSQIIEGAEKKGGRLVARFKNTDEYKKYMTDGIGSKNSEYGTYIVPHGAVFAFDEETVNSRYDAIKFAMEIAKFGDVIITEGKGHEKSLCFGTTEYPFTDQEAVTKSIDELGLKVENQV